MPPGGDFDRPHKVVPPGSGDSLEMATQNKAPACECGGLRITV
jgi:hypothetical protein